MKVLNDTPRSTGRSARWPRRRGRSSCSPTLDDCCRAGAGCGASWSTCCAWDHRRPDRRLERTTRADRPRRHGADGASHSTPCASRDPARTLTVGPAALAQVDLGPRWRPSDGIHLHCPTWPSGREVFTTPDPVRTEGVVRSHQAAVNGRGASSRTSRVEFPRRPCRAHRRLQGADTLRFAGCARRGRGSPGRGCAGGRIRAHRPAPAPVSTTPLLDENAASHIALGGASTSPSTQASSPASTTPRSTSTS